MEALEGSKVKEEKGERAIAGAIDEPNDSDRFISGGERSEETVRRLLGGVLYAEFAIARVSRGVCWMELRGDAGLGELQGRWRDAGVNAAIERRTVVERDKYSESRVARQRL